MNYFYSTRRDKAGNLLMTSYTNLAGVKKFAGDGNIEETVYTLTNNKMTVNGTEGLVVRSVLVNKGEIEAVTGQDYVVYAKIAGAWSPTPFEFPSYGNANTFMKDNISAYVALAVVQKSVAKISSYVSNNTEEELRIDI